MTIDTNILIAYLSGEEKVITILNEWKKDGRALYVPSIVYAETLAYPAITIADIDIIRNFVNEIILVPFDASLAESAALIKRTYKLELPDAAIAATALSRDVPLVTRDKQFCKIAILTVFSV